MVPRSYLYQSSRPTSTSGGSEKGAVAVAVRERSSKIPNKNDRTHGNGKPAWLSSAPAPIPSRPVVIPTHTRVGGRRRTKESLTKVRRASEEDVCHDPDSVPSSVAALFAMTSLPESRCQLQAINGHKSRPTSRIQRKADASHRSPRNPISTASPQSWDLLLSSPDDLDAEYSSFGSDTTLDAGSFVRSLSTDSMPSLDDDCGSLTSPPTSVPSTPGMSVRSRSGYERQGKEQSPKVENCILDHPLLAPRTADESDSDNDNNTEIPVNSHRGLLRPTSALKSNLSASFSLLRSAARSFSNFTTPAISRDEYLTRSLLPISPPFTDERRPLPTKTPPGPALRRYLNPINVSPSELHTHQDHLKAPSDRDRCTASIQLQSYNRGPRLSDKASAPPVFVSSKEKPDGAIVAAAEGPFSSPSPRQREPRENSDFLRVIVLEMNMRRKGQLGDGVPGKARMSLPARQAGKREGTEDVPGAAVEREVPRRWIAVRAY